MVTSAHLLANTIGKSCTSEIWSEPMRILAQQYNVSDVYLARVCRLLRFACRVRGYWAKKSAGKTTKKRPPLPPLPDGKRQAIHKLNRLNRRSNVSNANQRHLDFSLLQRRAPARAHYLAARVSRLDVGWALGHSATPARRCGFFPYPALSATASKQLGDRPVKGATLAYSQVDSAL